MNKFLIASDSFKGTLSTFDIMNLFSLAAKKVFPDSEVVKVPVSDGGEGFLSALFYRKKGMKISIDTVDALNRTIHTSYYIDEEHSAWIECASCLSFTLLEKKDPFITTSYGVGILILDAMKRGCKKIYLSLGGTSTNDFGLGMLCALGLKCFTNRGEEFIPTGGTLDKVKCLGTNELNANIQGVTFIGLYDVDCPLLGKKGSSLMFSKQKGADVKGSLLLERKMKELVSYLKQANYPDYSSFVGAGAAGGIGAGLLTFLHAELVSGIDFFLTSIDFDSLLTSVDVVFTGEGKIDGQTKEGKVIAGIIKTAKEKSIPVVAICGAADREGEKIIFDGLDAIVTTGRNSLPWEKVRQEASSFYYYSCLSALSLLKIGEQMTKK